MRLRIDLAYDGTGYHGFASQVDVPSVQGTLEGALTRVCGLLEGRGGGDGPPFADKRVATTCAGRTDKGVHALAQVVHVDLDAGWSTAVARVVTLAAERPQVLRRRLDDLVGDAITVWSVAVVGEDFNARFCAGQRRYRYVMTDARSVDPRGRDLRWDVGEHLDVEAMGLAAQPLAGEHDYASFCRQAAGGHTTRRIDEIAVARVSVRGRAPGGHRDEVHLTVHGKAFCHQQVRSIAGCLVEVGCGRQPVAWVAQVLAARDRAVAARVAPPGGLVLEGVSYPDPWPDAPNTVG